MEYLTLLGVAIIVIGFILKLDVLAVVLVAGITTGLIAGIDMLEILAILGESFVKNRLMSIFLIMLPIIAIIERYGLKERAAQVIGGLKNASGGMVLGLYMVIRSLASAFNIRIGGVVQFVRPLVLPMSQGAAKAYTGKELTEEQDEELKGLSATTENLGNFFAQLCFPASSGVVLIQGTLVGLGYDVTLQSIAFSSIPVAIITIILLFIRVRMYDMKLKKGGNK